MSLNKLTALVEKLPEDLQQEVLDYVTHLLEKTALLYRQLGGERVAGLHEGQS